MKLANLGLRFVVDGEEKQAPSSDRPTALLFNGRSMYVLSCCEWGFVLEPDDRMMLINLAASFSGHYDRKDLAVIVVDSPGFKTATPLVKIEKIRAAIIARASKDLGDLVSNAVGWWIDQVREKESQSP